MLHLVCPLFSRRAPFQPRRWPFASDTSPKMVFDCLGDMNCFCLFVSFSGDLVLFVFGLPFQRLEKTDVWASPFPRFNLGGRESVVPALAKNWFVPEQARGGQKTDGRGYALG